VPPHPTAHREPRTAFTISSCPFSTTFA
jgi:hypothetical protein